MICRAALLLALVLACLATSADAREPQSRGVVVFANRTPRSVTFTIGPLDNPAKKFTLSSHGVTTVPIDGPLELTFTHDGNERKYALDANSAYYFSQFPFGVDLEKAAFNAGGEFVPPGIARRRGPRSGPSRPKSRTEPTDTLNVKLVLDEHPKFAREKWEGEVRKRFEAAAQAIEHASGLKLKIAAIESWQPPKAGGLSGLEKEFEQVKLGEAWLVLGIVSSPAAGQPSSHPVPTPLSTHVLLSELPAPAGEAEKTAQLVHFFGHYLGAAESTEPQSVMHLEHAGAHARDAKANVGFDAPNTLAMHLIAADIRRHGLRPWNDLDEATQHQVRAIQASLQQAQWGQMANRELGADRRPQRGRPGRGQKLPAEMLFSGSLVDSTMLTGARVTNWHDTRTQPTLDHHPIFDARRPLRSLRNESVSIKSDLKAYVEFFGGDRLPGSTIRYEAAGGEEDGAEPARLVVEPTEPLFWRDRQEELRPARVLVGSVKRIVWQSRGERYQPGTVFYRGGGRLSFRSARFAADGLRLLADGELKQVAFSEIAEVHLPQVDPWPAYFQQLAVLTPSLSERLMYIQTGDGLIATTSTARLRAQGSDEDPRSWIHVIQPVWSLDPLWVRHAAIANRRFFDSSELPLSSLEPTIARRKFFFSSAWDWQANRNSQLGQLGCGVREFAWGIGTHAYSELQFDLPTAAESFRCLVGLDRIAASGGCARAIIYAGSTRAKPLFRSELLIGSARALDTGDLPLPHRAGQGSRLLLVAHPAHKERPSGADPLDIRDSVDWLEPLVTFNRAALSDAVHRSMPALIPAWAGWKLSEGNSASLVSLWDKTDSQNPTFRVEALPGGESLTLERTFHVRSASNHLEIAVSRFGTGVTPSKIEVLVDGESLDDFKVLIDNPRNPQTHLHSVPLDAYVGRDIEIRVVQHCEGKSSSAAWHRLALVE